MVVLEDTFRHNIEKTDLERKRKQKVECFVSKSVLYMLY